MADYAARDLMDDLRERVEKLEARVQELEEVSDDTLWEIPIECQVCGLVCNTDAEYDAHVRKEHPKQA